MQHRACKPFRCWLSYCLLLIDETDWDGQSLDALQALALDGNSL